MLAVERRNHILEKLQEEKKVVVSELSQLYDVSEETIRRDLDKLDKDGLCIKSYGGAILNENANIDMPFNVRRKRNPSGKQKIAEIVAERISDGEHIMLDASTTSIFIAKAIKHKKNLTVITNSIEIVIELSDVPDWTVISSGGEVKGEYLAMVGTNTVERLNSFNVEKSIISCKGFDLEKGFTDSNEQFAQAKQAMMRAGDKCILAVDSSKFGTVSFSKIGDLDSVDTIITDKKPDQNLLDRFEEMGITCLYPKE
ncbi:MAG: DeoR/GlpR family DNA-binding transcription regulator [Lachnospiraceae bacterium]|nr:DeoR/GlpR family DNA-binding transcription regulator [Lachnospiraceae bacterium]